MSVAQKLCDEIVDPAFNSSPNIEIPPKIENSSEKYSGKPPKRRSENNSCTKPNGKVTRSITVEKKKVVNKLIPRQCPANSRTVVNQYKTKEIVRKQFTDIAVNTLVTGPLKCDHQCLTNVRKKDSRYSCKCGKKCVTSKCAKQIQTFEGMDYSYTDKACSHCIETVNCGTQFLDRLSGILKPQLSTRARTFGTALRTEQQNTSFSTKTQHSNLEHKQSDLGYMGARRWALSRYPTRGPDF